MLPTSPSSAEQTQQPGRSFWTRVRALVGIDRAIGFTLLARGWSTLAGIGTIALIARYLDAAEQGYYYTFASLVALQMVFELGFSFVVLQLAAHEQAKISIHPDGTISGDAVAHSRLASVLQQSVRWYSVAAAVMAASLLFLGIYFFSVHRQPSNHIAWKLPWVCDVFAAVFTFQIDPVLSFLEGCGRVAEIARLRFAQAVTGSILAWTVLVLHHGLYAPAMMIGGQAFTGGLFLYSQRRLLLPLLQHNATTHAVSWRIEILPFQWRIAVSWLCGYFIFQIFTPVLFAYRGAAVAGQMGMSLSITSALGAIAVAWMTTKAAPFGAMIARADFVTLDRIFFRTLIQSSILLVSGAVFILAGLAVVERKLPHLAARVLPAPIFSLLLLMALLNHVLISEAIYLRAHKKEPLLPFSVMVAVLTGSSTLIAGKFWGAAGITIGYFLTSGVFGLSIATYIFLAKRKEWHSRGASCQIQANPYVDAIGS